MLSLLSSFAVFQVSNSDAAAAGIAGLGCLAIALFAILGLAILAFFIYCWWRICSKAGYSGAMSLLLLIPGIGPLILVLILAFGEWPINKNR